MEDESKNNYNTIAEAISLQQKKLTELTAESTKPFREMSERAMVASEQMKKLMNMRPIKMEIPVIKSPEENAWERHNEMTKLFQDNLGIQKSLLEEQKSNTQMTNKILWISISALVVALFSLITFLYSLTATK